MAVELSSKQPAAPTPGASAAAFVAHSTSVIRWSRSTSVTRWNTVPSRPVTLRRVPARTSKAWAHMRHGAAILKTSKPKELAAPYNPTSAQAAASGMPQSYVRCLRTSVYSCVPTPHSSTCCSMSYSHKTHCVHSAYEACAPQTPSESRKFIHVKDTARDSLRVPSASIPIAPLSHPFPHQSSDKSMSTWLLLQLPSPFFFPSANRIAPRLPSALGESLSPTM